MAGRVVEGKALCQLETLAFRHGHEFGVTTLLGHGEHAVAALERLYPRAGCSHRADGQLSRRERPLGKKLVLALQHQRVDEIGRNRGDLDENLALFRLRRREIFQLCRSHWPEFADNDGFHDVFSCVLKLPRPMATSF